MAITSKTAYAIQEVLDSLDGMTRPERIEFLNKIEELTCMKCGYLFRLGEDSHDCEKDLKDTR